MSRLLDIRPGKPLEYFAPSYRALPHNLIFNALPPKSVSLNILVGDEHGGGQCFCYGCKEIVSAWFAANGWSQTTVWSAASLKVADLGFTIVCEHQQTPLWSPNPMLAKHMHRIPAGAAVLDLGSGVGRDAVLLALAGARVVCVERRAKLAQICAQFCAEFGVPCEVLGAPPSSAEWKAGVTCVVANIDELLLQAFRDSVDVVHVSRFFHRSLLPSLKQLAAKLFFFHHFLVGSVRPASPDQHLAEGELTQLFAEDAWEIVDDSVILVQDGNLTRPCSSFVAVRR